MIRNFLLIIKSFSKFNKINEYHMFISAQNKSNKLDSFCPNCKAPSSGFVSKGFYKRYFITYHKDSTISNQVKIKCVQCTSCGVSHAILNSTVIPYSSFSMGFIISLLFAYFTGKFKSIELLCEHFDISVNTFYKIRKSFFQDKKLLNSIYKELRYIDELQTLEYLCSLNSDALYSILQTFFEYYNYSFLQRRCRLRLNNSG